jgi:hypothetical protein
MFIPGAIEALGVGDGGPIRIPGAMDGPGLIVAGGALGALVIPGIGAIVGDGEGFGTAGGGVAFFAGAGVVIGIPGMGAIVGCAATPGDTVARRKTATTLKRVASKRTS